MAPSTKQNQSDFDTILKTCLGLVSPYKISQEDDDCPSFIWVNICTKVNDQYF